MRIFLAVHSLASADMLTFTFGRGQNELVPVGNSSRTHEQHAWAREDARFHTKVARISPQWSSWREGKAFFFFFLIVTFQINNFLKWFKNTCHSWTTLYMGSHCFKGNLCHYVSNEVTYWSQLSVKSDLMRLFFTRFLVCKLMSTYMYKSIRSKTKMKLNLLTCSQFTCFFNSHVIFSFTLTGCGGNF